jgi:hypothetical protein
LNDGLSSHAFAKQLQAKHNKKIAKKDAKELNPLLVGLLEGMVDRLTIKRI